MSEYIRSTGDDQIPPAPVTLDSIARQAAEIIERQKAAETTRTWSMIIAGASALFAAVKLGIIAMPHLRRRSAAAGQLVPVKNPRQRRRRRRSRA